MNKCDDPFNRFVLTFVCHEGAGDAPCKSTYEPADRVRPFNRSNRRKLGAVCPRRAPGGRRCRSDQATDYRNQRISRKDRGGQPGQRGRARHRVSGKAAVRGRRRDQDGRSTLSPRARSVRGRSRVEAGAGGAAAGDARKRQIDDRAGAYPAQRAGRSTIDLRRRDSPTSAAWRPRCSPPRPRCSLPRSTSTTPISARPSTARSAAPR